MKDHHAVFNDATITSICSVCVVRHCWVVHMSTAFCDTLYNMLLMLSSRNHRYETARHRCRSTSSLRDNNNNNNNNNNKIRQFIRRRNMAWVTTRAPNCYANEFLLVMLCLDVSPHANWLTAHKLTPDFEGEKLTKIFRLICEYIQYFLFIFNGVQYYPWSVSNSICEHVLSVSCWNVFTVYLLAQNYLWLAVWLSGNALASINVVALRQTRLVPGWVTVRGQVNHLCM